MNTPRAATDKINRMTTEQLIDAFELSSEIRITAEVAMVRGWLMDELESRNQAAFDRFIDSGEDSPRKFYMEKSHATH